MSRAFRSGIFVSAILSTCWRERRPTFVRLGSPEPLSRRSASLISTAAGGVFVMKVKERSSKTVISTGMIRPFSACVCALNALQNSMMLTPCWPSAGPTGGAGLAWPPGICSLMSVSTFFANLDSYRFVARAPLQASQTEVWHAVGDPNCSVDLFHLVEPQLNRNLALEDVDEHPQLLLLRVDLDDLAVEVGERP